LADTYQFCQRVTVILIEVSVADGIGTLDLKNDVISPVRKHDCALELELVLGEELGLA